MVTSSLRSTAVFLALGTGAGAAQVEPPPIEILLPGTALDPQSPTPTGLWWVLDAAGLRQDSLTLTSAPGCEPDGPADRIVTVSGADRPILLMRGIALTAGPVDAVFIDDGATGEAPRIDLMWGDQSVVVEHRADDPVSDQPGRYEVTATVGGRRFALHRDRWHGEGHWQLRWVGDLNRDGAPDLLLDASYKYSVYTTRLFLSHRSHGQVTMPQAAVLTHYSC